MKPCGRLIVTWTNHEIPSTSNEEPLRDRRVVAQPLVGPEIPPRRPETGGWTRSPATPTPRAVSVTDRYYKNEDGVVFPSYDHAIVRIRSSLTSCETMRAGAA